MSTAVTIIGNITRDPELRFSQGGVAMLSFSVAVNKNKKNKTTGEWEKETSYFDCVTFKENAENFASSLTKGARVIVTGSLQQRTYEAKDENGNLTGKNVSKVELVADEIGATLKYATLAVTKTEYKGNSDYDDNGSYQRPAPKQSLLTEEEPF